MGCLLWGGAEDPKVRHGLVHRVHSSMQFAANCVYAGNSAKTFGKKKAPLSQHASDCECRKAIR